MRRVFVLVMAVGLILGVTASLATAAPAPKVDVCHYDADMDTFHLINISENAFEQHLAHGDASPGDPVPGGYGQFTADCGIEARLIVDGASSGLYSSRLLSVAFTVYEEPDGSFSGFGDYSFATTPELTTTWPLTVTGACVDETTKQVTVWGPADPGYFGMLSLYDYGSDPTIMKVRAGHTGTLGGLPIAQQCGDLLPGTAPIFPATGSGYLTFF